MLCTRCGKLNILKAKYCEVCTPYVRIAELEGELKHQQHMADKEYRRYKELEAKYEALREVANLAIDLVEDYTVTDKRLVAAVAKLLEQEIGE